MPSDRVVPSGEGRAEPSDETMVLRTVFLPQAIDTWLKRAAFQTGTTKNEIMRCALAAYLEANFKRFEHVPE